MRNGPRCLPGHHSTYMTSPGKWTETVRAALRRI